MEETKTLKDIAANAATSTPIPTTPPMESELADSFGDPTPLEPAETARTSSPAPTMVGDTPVIIAPTRKPAEPQKVEMPKDPNMEALMNAGTEAPAPTPVAIGIEDDTLASPPVAPIPPMAAQGTPAAAAVKMSPEFEQMLIECAPDIPEDERNSLGLGEFMNISNRINELIIKAGFSYEDAVKAANSQVRKVFTDENAKYQNENPEAASVVIDKTADVNDLGLTTEEHQKLEKVKKVRLVVVEDADLATITIERPDEKHKADYVKSIEGSLSKYNVPLPMLGDFVGFKGAQIVQMINIVNYDDARIDEIINTKASLIYEKMISGSVLHKFDDEGKSIMTYTEFINKFPYQDMDMALYGILCASSMEEASTSLTCEGCAHTWDQKYNLKSLLKMDEITDEFKGRVDDILRYKSNDLELYRLYDNMRKAKRYKSPFTGNIYDLSYPTVARAINLLKRIDQNDTVMTYISAIGLYLSRILIYNEVKKTYVEVTAEETDLMLDTLQTLTNEDMNMLALQIRADLHYAPKFALDVECPSCHKKSSLPLSVDNLIFLKAQDSMVEIDS